MPEPEFKNQGELEKRKVSEVIVAFKKNHQPDTDPSLAAYLKTLLGLFPNAQPYLINYHDLKINKAEELKKVLGNEELSGRFDRPNSRKRRLVVIRKPDETLKEYRVDENGKTSINLQPENREREIKNVLTIPAVRENFQGNLIYGTTQIHRGYRLWVIL